MAPPRAFEVQCINVRVHTKHSAEEYEALWKIVGRTRFPMLARSGAALMIGESARREAPPARGFFGEFYRFVQINPDDPWFDITKHKIADPADLAKVNIPANLRPNLRQFPYFFDIDKHRLYFASRADGDSLSSGTVLKLLESICGFREVFERFGAVNLTVAAETEAVEQLLNWPVLNRLRILLERPNPTDYEDEEAVFKHLNNIGADSEVREYVRAGDRPTLRPDDEMRALANVAATNGVVEVRGQDPSGARRTASSQEFQWVGKRTYDPRHDTLIGAFLKLVGDMFMRKI